MKNTVERRNFAWPVTSMDQENYDGFFAWFSQNQTLLSDHRLYIWGAGIRGTSFGILLREQGVHGFTFVDSNPEKWGGFIDEAPIISPEELEANRAAEKRIILISVENSDAIQRELNAKGYRKDQDYFAVETDAYAAYVQEFLRPYGKNLLIMGDCEFTTISINDTRHDSLREKLYRRCGKEQVKILAMHGMGPRAEYNIFHALIAQGKKPERLALMVNFDVLTGKQHLLPRSQHAELFKLLLEEQEAPSEEFRDYVRLTQERSENLQMEFFTGPECAAGLSDAKARNYIRLNYLYDMDTSSEGVQYLEKLLDEAASEGVKTLAFIPPFNYQMAERLMGSAYQAQYKSNQEKIHRVINAHGVRLLDMSFELSSDLFSTPDTVSETSNDPGREIVADLLCRAIEEL